MFFLSREIKDQMVMKGQRWDHRLKLTTNPLYLNDEFTHIWKFYENLLILRPSKMKMSLFLHQNRFCEM